MRKSKRKVQYVALPQPPKLPSLPDIQMGGVQLTSGKGRVRVPPNQTQFEDIETWGWWLSFFPQSSFPEYLCAEALVKLGHKMIGCPRPSWRGDSFIFQKNALTNAEGLLPGVFNATVVDFLDVENYPYVAIFVDGLFFHLPTEALDISKRSQLRQYTNWNIITIDDIHLLQDAQFYVKEAFAGRDHSHLANRY